MAGWGLYRAENSRSEASLEQQPSMVASSRAIASSESPWQSRVGVCVSCDRAPCVLVGLCFVTRENAENQ